MGGTIEALLEEGRREGIELGIEQGIEQGREQGIQQGIEQGMQQGRQQGEVKNAMNNAETMLADGVLPVDKIALYSGLPLKTVQEMAKKYSA